MLSRCCTCFFLKKFCVTGSWVSRAQETLALKAFTFPQKTLIFVLSVPHGVLRARCTIYKNPKSKIWIHKNCVYLPPELQPLNYPLHVGFLQCIFCKTKCLFQGISRSHYILKVLSNLRIYFRLKCLQNRPFLSEGIQFFSVLTLA